MRKSNIKRMCSRRHGNSTRDHGYRFISARPGGLLEEKFPQAALKPLSTQNVGAVVGAEIQRSAIVASLLSLFGILVYVSFRYEFSLRRGCGGRGDPRLGC